MRLERTKNTKRNVLTGVFNKVIGLVLPFALRTVMIYVMGIEYVGINSLFSSILSVLSLAELGFGTAVVYSMYKPIAEDDTETICALMAFYRKCYAIIGTVIIVAGLILLPFLPNLISGDLPVGLNIYILYLISLFSTGITYFLFGYKNCLLNAFQRNDISSLIGTAMTTIRYVVEIALLLLFRNYYIYAIVLPIINISTNIITSLFVDRMFPQYKARGELQSDIKKQISQKIRGLFVYKVGNVVINSADTIVISAFLGLTVLGQYQNYYYIITSLFGFFSIIYTSVGAGIGNVIVSDGKEKAYDLFKTMLLLQAMLVSWCTTCLLCLYQPFIELWVGEENLLPMSCVVCLVIYFFQWKMQDIVYVFKEAGGMWDRDKFRPLVTACCNLVLNLIMVQFIGLYGVLLSTILVGIFIDMPWACRILYKGYFDVSPSDYYKKMLIYALMTLCICIPTYCICSLINTTSWLTFIGKGIICCTVPVAIGYVLFSRFSEFEEAKKKIKQIIKAKL